MAMVLQITPPGTGPTGSHKPGGGETERASLVGDDAEARAPDCSPDGPSQRPNFYDVLDPNADRGGVRLDYSEMMTGRAP